MIGSSTLPKELLGGMPRTDRLRQSPRDTPAVTDASTAISNSCTSLWAFPGPALDHPDYYAAAVLSTAFEDGMSSRLFQEIREKRGWFTRSIPLSTVIATRALRNLRRHRRGRGGRAGASVVRAGGSDRAGLSSVELIAPRRR